MMCAWLGFYQKTIKKTALLIVKFSDTNYHGFDVKLQNNELVSEKFPYRHVVYKWCNLPAVILNFLKITKKILELNFPDDGHELPRKLEKII